MARDTTKGIDFNLDPILGSISGRATDEDGHPRTSVSVCALSFHSLERQGVGRTDADGTYLISGLPTGTYIVEIPRYRYAGVYFDQAQDVAHATPVEVTAPHKTSGIDFVLGPIGSIAGQLTYGGVPLSKDSGSVFIIAYDAESGAFRGIDFGSSDGNYEIDGLPPGDYKIAALPSICWSEDPCPYTITYYGGGRTFADSTSLRVTVLPDQTVSGIDIEMKSAGGFISGHFYDGSMGGLLINLDESFYVYVYDDSAHLVSFNAYIDYPFPTAAHPAGNYQIGPLHSGQYFLRCHAKGGEYGDVWYESAPVLQPIRDRRLESYVQDIPPEATPVFVTDDEETENIDFNLAQHVTAVEEEEHSALLPNTFALVQNYPNPFNPTTAIRYAIPSREQRARSLELRAESAECALRTTLKIYNILGQVVRTLVDETTEAGYHTVTWDGKNERGDEVSSGVYLVQLTAGNFSDVKRMVLLK